MKVLIVESDEALGELWARHLTRMGAETVRAISADAAMARLAQGPFDVIVLDLVLRQGSALAVSDYAQLRHPEAKVIFVTNTSFFSDGSIFSLASNACAFLRSGTNPEDLAAMVAHHGRAA